MVKIKILDKGINTTHFGYLAAGSTVDVPGHFGDWLVKTNRGQKVAGESSAKAPKKSAKK